MKTKIIVIVGPTAVWENCSYDHLAQALNGKLSVADQQVYRKLDIGTTKATEESLITSFDRCTGGDRSYSAFDFVREAKTAIRDLASESSIIAEWDGSSSKICSRLSSRW